MAETDAGTIDSGNSRTLLLSCLDSLEECARRSSSSPVGDLIEGYGLWVQDILSNEDTPASERWKLHQLARTRVLEIEDWHVRFQAYQATNLWPSVKDLELALYLVLFFLPFESECEYGNDDC